MEALRMLAGHLAVQINVNRAKGAPRAKIEDFLPRYVYHDPEEAESVDPVDKAMRIRNSLLNIAVSRRPEGAKNPKWLH